MATRTPPQISINGDDTVDGTLAIEHDGQLKSWHGAVYAAHMPGQRVRVMAFTNGHVYLGNALITACDLPKDETPISTFMGDGPLALWSLPLLVEVLAQLEAAER